MSSSGIQRKKRKKVDVNEFIRRANKRHGVGRYDYSKVSFDSQEEHVTIICPHHGEFLMQARTHIRGRGCRKCWIESPKKIKSQNHFINRVQEIHGDHFDLSESIYKGCESLVTVRCIYHDYYHETTPKKLYKGYGCKLCWYETLSSNTHSREILSDSRPCSVYHITIIPETGESFDKVGITTKSLSRRLEALHLEGFEYTVNYLIRTTFKKARMCESAIFEEIRNINELYKVRNLKGTRTGGWTECFKCGVFDPSPIMKLYENGS